MRPEPTRSSSKPTSNEIDGTETNNSCGTPAATLSVTPAVANHSVTAVGYVRVSTIEQADHGAGLEAQRRAITLAAEAREWNLARIFEDGGASGKNLKRPGLQAALNTLDRGDAQILVISKLDRLSRSLIDFAGLMERASKKGWDLAALDLGVDTSTPQGEMVASVMATFAQFERRLIGLRTKEALAVKRSQGVRLGRPPVVAAEVVARIRELREAPMSYRQVAEELDRAGVPTAHGAPRWHANTVRRLYLADAPVRRSNRRPAGPL